MDTHLSVLEPVYSELENIGSECRKVIDIYNTRPDRDIPSTLPSPISTAQTFILRST